jgi:hypothetical protein
MRTLEEELSVKLVEEMTTPRLEYIERERIKGF